MPIEIQVLVVMPGGKERNRLGVIQKILDIPD
jgi:hypothetical protein